MRGGPITLLGAFTSPMIFGGEALRSMIETVSAAGFFTTLMTPLSSVTLLSFELTAISAWAVSATLMVMAMAFAMAMRRLDM